MRKIYGTTIFIGSSELETQYGKFTAYVFQDVIDIKYIFALVHGSLDADDFYIRLHSSCLTSETLRSMDCDCVQQLNAALENIVKKSYSNFSAKNIYWITRLQMSEVLSWLSVQGQNSYNST